MSTAPQRLLQALFMRAEGVFNRAFGDRLNPLYHLGAMAFFLFWVVAATGLVLFAFFDTSVGGAHRSVERIVAFAGGAGGVLRTVHRHASDAMVAVMLVHLLRAWAFDRLRGFRWFSWATGVALLWFAYLAGVNGYMLPWDRLAQFVTQAAFEWLDWLPGFGGTLSRNFILPEHVNDRLFSLLVFIHIGVPLAMLLLMWVHVQRVPKAATAPPRPIALALLAMLLVLALAAPVRGHAPADLHSAPVLLALDWFLLPVFPLLYAWSPAAVWALVGAGTLLLAALPWLPPRRGGAARRLQITLHPGPARISARPGETLLEAGLRAGLALPYDCRAGGCGRCVCAVLGGRVEHGPVQQDAFTPAMRARGQALMCCAVPLDDVEIEVPGVASLAADAARAQRYRGIVQRMQRLSPQLMCVFVELPPGQHIDYAAGQYIDILPADGTRRSFSFASAPPEPGTRGVLGAAGDVIELHIRLIPGGRYTSHVFETMREGDAMDFEGPFGHFGLTESERPILLVAGATGFAPIKSMLEEAFRRGMRRPIELYWGVRTRDDLYLQELVERWQREHANFRFVPVLSHAEADTAWSGRRGFVHEVLLLDHPDLAGCEVYACGSVAMVRSAVPDFLAHGLSEQQCFSDAFVPQTPQRSAAAAAAEGGC